MERRTARAGEEKDSRDQRIRSRGKDSRIRRAGAEERSRTARRKDSPRIKLRAWEAGSGLPL